MTRILFPVFVLLLLAAGSCTKARTHCYRCIDLNQVDPSFTACANDTSAAGRNAYAVLSSGHPVYNSNGAADSCQAFDK